MANSAQNLTRVHSHDMRIISLTLEGPLKLLTSCSRCAKTEVLVPTSRKRKLPAGVTQELWSILCLAKDEDLPVLRGRIMTRLEEVFG